ncbi:MAG TPA: peptidoglycan DD-metalloendopeptidase family protein [Nocardioidaceae bacterium]|nr:peptidoglycan DD-metalloendopeptidase family protein [Nocardioidaceae bacterium]
MARLRPHGRRQWIVATALASALGVLATTASTPQVPASAASMSSDPDHKRNELKDRKSDVNDRLNGAHADLDESSAELQAAVRALNSAQTKLTAAQNNLARTRGQLQAAEALDQRMQERLADAEQRLSDARDALADARHDVRNAKDRLADFVVASYEYGSPGLVSLGIVLHGGSPSEYGERISLADSVVDAQSGVIDDLEANEKLSQAREAAVETLRDEVAKARQAARENLIRKRALEQKAEEQTQQVQALVAQRQAAEQQAEAAKQVDLQRIKTLEAKREQIKDRLQRIAERQNGPGITVNNSGGWLSYPVTNPIITSPYGMRMHPILHVWKLHDGTDFGVDCGTPVYAAASGTVISAYYDDAYGNRLTINHGNVNGVALATSYNHLTSFAASVGEHVKRGELVAYSGTTGWSTGCHLHFMVYENGSTVDPMSWL